MRRFVFAVVAALFAWCGAAASELKFLSGSAVQPVMNELIPQFERGSGHKVTFNYGTVGGMAARVQSDERADVIIASASQISALEKEEKVISESRTDLAKTGIGIFVRKGAPNRTSFERMDPNRTLASIRSRSCDPYQTLVGVATMVSLRPWSWTMRRRQFPGVLAGAKAG
jgi:ABC-type molybdate transport system substrate-binding protein